MSMKILLLNPPAQNTIKEFPNEKGEGFIETEDFGCFPPLGLLYILSYAEKYTSGHEFFLFDCVAEKISYEDLPEKIAAVKPDLVGITSFTISLIDVCKTAQVVRNVCPQAHICMGGHHPIAFPFEACQLSDFDSIVVGEGEQAFTALIGALESSQNIAAISGVYTKESIVKYKNAPGHDDRFLSNVMVPPAYVDDIDMLPVPARRYIAHIKYHSILGVSKKLATIISSRGCPYGCTFCDVPYKRYRKRSIAGVVDEVEECLKLGYEEFHFYDDLFNITPQRVIEFCDELEKRRLKIKWDFRGRVNTATEESLERAKRAGCRLISFGVETGSDKGLEVLNKGTTVKKITEVFGWCRKLGIKTVADFMIGLPSETSREDVLKNINFLIKLDPDYPQIAILCLYPNTAIYNQAIEKKLIDSEKWHQYALNPQPSFTVDHWEEFLSIAELVQLQKTGYRNCYLRPGYIIRNILNTRSMYEFKTKWNGFLTLLSIRKK